MCVNAFGWGALHMWIFVSAPICILTALGGQAYGCSETSIASGYATGYVCNENEEGLFFFNNMWQTTVWAILVLFVALFKPLKTKLLLVFSPFLVLAAVLILFAPEQKALQDTNKLTLLISSLVWFGSFAFAFAVHIEPNKSNSPWDKWGCWMWNEFGSKLKVWYKSTRTETNVITSEYTATSGNWYHCSLYPVMYGSFGHL